MCSLRFYDETWALLREAYAAVEPLLPENYAIKKLTDAFLPQTDTFAMAMDQGSNEWVRWQVKVPLHAYDPRVEAAPEVNADVPENQRRTEHVFRSHSTGPTSGQRWYWPCV